MAAYSLAMAAVSTACVAMYRLMTRKPAIWTGASSPCPAIPQSRLNTPKWKSRHRLGRAANGGKSAAAERSGIRSFMTPKPTRYFWGLAMAHPGMPASAILKAITAAPTTTCSYHPFWRWTLIQALTVGTIRVRLATSGISPQPSRWCSLICRWVKMELPAEW